LALAGCLLITLAGTSGAAGAATSTTGPESRLAPGMTAPLHAELAASGAFGHHPVRLLIVGDSIALTLGIGLGVDVGPTYGTYISDHATLGCDLDPTLEIMDQGQPGPATDGCNKWRALWPFLAAREHPQVVALGVGRWEISDHLYQGQWVHIGDATWDAHLTADLQDAIRIFHQFGAKVVLFNMPYIDPSDVQPDGLPWPENSPQRTQAFNALLEKVARADPHEVTVINLNKMLSPHGAYAAEVDGITTRWPDGIHISTAGGEFLQRQILPLVDRLGLQAEAAAGRTR
jgi:hypothetical protein